MNRRTCIPVLVFAALAGALDAAAQDRDLTIELGVRGFMGELDGRLRNAPGISHVTIDDDLDSGGDAAGMGVSLTGRLRGGHSVNIQAWQIQSDGENTVSEGQTWGTLTLAPGDTAEGEVDVRFVSTSFLFGLSEERSPFQVGLGIAGKVIDWKTEILLDTGASDSQKMRIIYPAGEIEFSYRIGEAVVLKAGGSLGMPAFTKNSVEIQSPYEVRAGAQIALAGLLLEVGYQVYDALLIENENQPEENSASVNLAGVYFEVAARF